MQAIIFALISFLGWGIGDIFLSLTSKKIGPYSLTLYEYIFSLLVSSALIPFFLSDFSKLTFPIFALTILLGGIYLISLLFYYEGLKIGPVSLVGTISSSFAALVVVLSIIFLGEKVRMEQLVSIIIIFVGLILSTLDINEVRNKKFVFTKGIVFALIAMFLWGIYFTFIKIPVHQVGWFVPGYISLFVFPLLFIFAKKQKIKFKSPTFKGVLATLLIAVIFVRIADYGFNFAVGNGLTAIVAPIAGSYPTLFVVLAFLVFKESIKKQQIIGITTTLVGIVLLSVFSV